MELILALPLFAALAVIPAKIASARGYSFAPWWWYGLFLFPIAFLHAISLARSGPTNLAGLKTCPNCAETVQGRASVCRYCTHDFGPQTYGIAAVVSAGPMGRPAAKGAFERYIWVAVSVVVFLALLVLVGRQYWGP